MTPVRLSDLGHGSWARIAEIRLDADASRLLQLLGVRRWDRVRLCQSRGGSIIQVRSTRVALSETVAAGIFVVVEPAAEG